MMDGQMDGQREGGLAKAEELLQMTAMLYI